MGTPLPPGLPAGFWDDYRKRIESDIANERAAMEPLESGQMTLRESIGNEPWRDITAETIARHKRVIATFEGILAALKRGELR